ncbi:MAG: hypothetical protein K5746_01670 [Clostridiales bacterium]|nr:hypothetical protein [Clostridiales bacterium]
MNLTLIGMPLQEALDELRSRGVEPEVRLTSAPRQRGETVLRVLCVSQDGKRMTTAPFAVPGMEGPTESQD